MVQKHVLLRLVSSAVFYQRFFSSSLFDVSLLKSHLFPIKICLIFASLDNIAHQYVVIFVECF